MNPTASFVAVAERRGTADVAARGWFKIPGQFSDKKQSQTTTTNARRTRTRRAIAAAQSR